MSKKTIVSLICAIALATLTACGGGSSTANLTQGSNTASTRATAAVSAPAANNEPAAADALAANSQTHEAVVDDEPATAETFITLNGDSIDASGDGIKVDGSKATITAAGTYRISGALADGQIVVDTEDVEDVTLILDGVDIHNSTGAAIDVAAAEVAIIMLADGTENSVTDGESYVFDDPATDEPNAAIFSKADLTIAGSGSLAVNGNFNDGIASKDGLIIAGGAITVDAADDGIRGKDYLVVKDGAITVTAQGDGLKSDNEEDATKGYISIEAGVMNVTAAGGDAIQAQTDVAIAGGVFVLTAGGGSGSRVDETTSAKGIKAGVNAVIEGGTFTIDSADDAIHSNGTLTVNGGQFDIATGDDGMHADAELTVNDGEFNITRSYEGIESAVITLNVGDFNLVSSDDGLNVAGGSDGSGMDPGIGLGGRPGRGGGPGQDAFAATSNQVLRINGGRIAIDADGDGIDINGAVEMTGGVLIVHGPTQSMNGALDYDRSFTITGGYLIAAGSAGMAQVPDESSSQLSILMNFSSAVQAGTLVHLQSSDGAEIFTFAPTKAYQSAAFRRPIWSTAPRTCCMAAAAARGQPRTASIRGEPTPLAARWAELPCRAR